ncbi:transcription antitermination factor NusB [bacterium]|nr:transcription antitermination factor NusB [bacterium]
MQARRAARELAFILFSQFDEKISNYTKENMDDIIIKSIRLLISSSNEELKTSLGALIDMKNRIEDYEAEHDTNLNRPMGASNIAVPMVMTSEMVEKIDSMIDVAEKAILGLEIAEFTALDAQPEVKDFAVKIAQTYRDNSDKIDQIIREYAKGWDFDRLVKMDKDILRISICELLFIKESPMKVVVDEAVELAKKYSTDDSASFVNGILAKVIVDNGIK